MTQASSLLPQYTQVLPTNGNYLIDDFFAKVARKVTIPDCALNPTPKNLRSAIQQMQNELDLWISTSRKLRPFEGLSDADTARVVHLQDTITHYQMALKGYSQRMDMSFLAERRGNYPYFGLITTSDHSMTFKAAREYRTEKAVCHIYPHLPPDLKSYYNDTISYIGSMLTGDKIGEIFITSSPTGMMSDKVRSALEVSERSGYFNRGIYIVFQADWKLNVKIRVQKDPLIIGSCHGLNGPLYFLIDKYDPTPMEDYVAWKHATAPK